MLKLQNIQGGYRKGFSILNGVSLQINEGETLAVLGQNGCGKSTLAKAILNLLPFMSGEVSFNGNELNGSATIKRIDNGIGYFKQGGKVFQHLTIHENMRLAAHNQNEEVFKKHFQELKSYISILKNDTNVQASYLSGGEKHQLALAMVLINKPKFLILDEPSAGLSPANVEIMYQILGNIQKNENISIMLIEQNVEKAIKFSNRVALLRHGIITNELDGDSVNTVEQINEFYFKLHE